MSADEQFIGVDVSTTDIHCSNCEETYSASDVAEQIAEWTDLLRWIQSHPMNVPIHPREKAAG